MNNRLSAIRNCCFCLLLLLTAGGHALADVSETIERVKPAIVAVGTYNKTSNPQFNFRGTGFGVGDGHTIATNAHVIPEILDQESGTTTLAVLYRNGSGEPQTRKAALAAKDNSHDLALLAIDGPPLPRLTLRDSDKIREGLSVAFTGFPIGAALGFSPVTHRGMISAITPIALPSPTSQRLNEKLAKRLRIGSFNVFQLDATAYPGNSGSPVFDLDSGEVIGIINMVFIKGTRESALSQPTGISYALPANLLQELMQSTRK